MDTRNAKLIQSNMVVVFQELKFGQILYELARSLLPGHPAPLITEIPNQLLVVVYPDRKLKCQFASRRVDVTDGRDVSPGTPPFGLVAINAIEAVRRAEPQTPMVAYGYNYDIHVPLELDGGDYIQTRFFAHPDQLGTAFGGRVEGVGIKAVVQSNTCQINFDLEPVVGQPRLLKAHANYHFQGRQPPADAEALANEALDRFEHFKQAMERL